MICKFEAWEICGCVFEVNYYQLLMLVRRCQQRRFSWRFQPKQVSVLRLKHRQFEVETELRL